MPIRRSALSMRTIDLADPLNGGNFNLESAQKGNLGAEFFSIWVEPIAQQGTLCAARRWN